MTGNSITAALFFLLPIFPFSLASGQSPPPGRQDGTTVSTSYRWINAYESRYGQPPDEARSFPADGTTVVEYDTQTLRYRRTLFYSKQPLSSVTPEISSSGNYYSIEYSDWSKQLVREDIPGEYDTIKDFGVIIGPDASVIRLFEDVVGLHWLQGDEVFIMQGVPTEACPDYHIDHMSIYDAEQQSVIEVIDPALFCGRYPEFEDSTIIFPCCREDRTRVYSRDTVH